MVVNANITREYGAKQATESSGKPSIRLSFIKEVFGQF